MACLEAIRRDPSYSFGARKHSLLHLPRLRRGLRTWDRRTMMQLAASSFLCAVPSTVDSVAPLDGRGAPALRHADDESHQAIRRLPRSQPARSRSPPCAQWFRISRSSGVSVIRSFETRLRPVMIARYCLPPVSKVIGGALMPTPTLIFHSGSRLTSS